MIKPNPPCKDCNERYSACHSNCKNYLDYRNNLNNYNDTVRSYKNKENDYKGYKKNAFKKANKK